ncbi:E3 ubiquitin ligase [Knufia fluminis]|uniref:E3 ubiquitin ligase n=1 Tax=Knufia fluminis TaxID=191047 RepID=A0AAN8IKU8_9EURO|nr:E3 ubiquitin ligase [Knufia fluminis]
MATANGGSVQTLQKHIEDMRSLVMCKICLKPFYEPYILSCGHTYCYGCLNNWFNGSAERRRNNKNCPDCRTVVKVQPAPNYLLRDMTHMFIGRIELLPEDESVEEHNRDKDEEASVLIKDRMGPGLFRGIFKNGAHRSLMPYGPIRDHEDGVMRCPECHWEIEDGICMGCGLGLNADSDISLSDSIGDEISISDDSDSSEDESAVEDLPVPQPMQQFYGVASDSEDDEEDTHYDGSQDLDNYDVHDDFVDDENEIDADDMDAIDGIVGYAEYPSEPGTPHSDGTSYTVQNDDEHEAWVQQQFNDMFDQAPGVEFGSDVDEQQEEGDEPAEEEEEDDDDEIIRPASRSRRPAPPTGPVPTYRRRPVVISDDEEDAEEGQTFYPSATVAAPLPISEHEDSSDESEEEADDSEAESSGSSSDNDSDASTDTVIPPQSNRLRRQRLEAHRARRPAPNNRPVIDLVTSPIPRRQQQPQRQQQHSRSRPAAVDVVRNARRNRVSVH